MSHVNKVILMGNLGKDPEITTFDSGKLAKFSLATSEKYTDKAGKKVEETTWHNVTVWGNLADIVEKYLTKGKLIYLEGRIKNRTWDDKEGVKRYATDIVANVINMVPTSSNGSSSSSADTSEQPAPEAKKSTSSSSKTSSPPPKKEVPQTTMTDTDNDLPF